MHENKIEMAIQRTRDQFDALLARLGPAQGGGNGMVAGAASVVVQLGP